MQLADIPRRIFVALVVDDTGQLRVLLGQILNDAGYFLHPQLLGGFQAGVPCDYDVVRVNRDRVQEPKLTNTLGDFCHARVIPSGVSLILNEVINPLVDNLHVSSSL